MSFYKALDNILSHPGSRGKKIATLGKVLWWKVNQLFFHLPVKVPLSSKTSMLCYPDSSFGSYVVYVTWPEYAETLFLTNYLKKDDVFLDIGAHLGEYSLLASEIVTTGTIIAFEPTPSSRKLLEENVFLNNRSAQITVDAHAVSSKKGTALFALEREDETNHLITKNESTQKGISVATTTLDLVIQKMRFKKVDLVKVDVEGAEPAILQGASQILKKGLVKVFILEINPKTEWYIHKPATVFTTLEKCGYHFFSFTESGKLTTFDSKSKIPKTINVVAAHHSILNSRIKKHIEVKTQR